MTDVTVRELVPRVRIADPQLPPPPPPVDAAQPPHRFTPRTARAMRTVRDALNLRRTLPRGALLPVILIAWLSLVTQLDTQAFILLLPDIQVSLGISVGVLTLLTVTLPLMIQALSPVSGYVADRARRVTMLAGGAVVAHASIAITGASPGAGLLGLSRVIGAVGNLVAGPAGYSLGTDLTPPAHRSRFFVLFGIGGTLGVAGGPLIAGVIAANFGWRAALIGLGTVAALVSCAYFFIREPVRGMQDRLAAGATLERALTEERPLGWTEAWRAAWSVRTIRIVGFASPFLLTAGFATVIYTSLYYSEHFHVDVLPRAVIVGLSGLPAIVGLLLSGPITDGILAHRPGRIMSLLAGVVVVQAAGMLLFINTPFLVVAIAANIIPAFAAALVTPALNTIISVVIPPRIRGLGLQTIAPWSFLALVLSLLLSGVANTSGVGAGLAWVIPLLLAGGLIISSGGRGLEQDMRAALAASVADEAARRLGGADGRTLLVIRDLEVTYEGTVVIPGLDLDIQRGEVLVLLGSNGAGKSTLLRVIAGVERPSNGAVFLAGDNITHLPPHQVAERGVVVVPGGQGIFAALTVDEHLRIAAHSQRHDPEFVKRRISEVWQRFPRLEERRRVPAGEMSGGEQQMLTLAMAFLMRPVMLLVDELSLGLAPHVVAELLPTLRAIASTGTAVVLVEQSVNVALEVADRAIYLDRGRVTFDGPVAELVGRGDIVQSLFIGTAASGGSSTIRNARGGDDEVETVLAVSDIRLGYGGVQVLDGVSFSAQRGELVGIVGPNGAGKTSLFDVVAGFAQPQSGHVELLGRDITTMPPDERARLGLARSFQHVRLFPGLTVRENIAVALERHLSSRSVVHAALHSPVTTRSERRAMRRVDHLVEAFGLQPHADKFVSELSTGTRRVVDIACMLAAQPRLLLLDEPSSGLAQAEVELLGPLVRRIIKEANCTVVMIEHDIGLVASLSDRMLAMRLGRVIADGSPHDVMNDNEVMETLMGGAPSAVVARSVAMPAAVSGRG